MSACQSSRSSVWSHAVPAASVRLNPAALLRRMDWWKPTTRGLSYKPPVARDYGGLGPLSPAVPSAQLLRVANEMSMLLRGFCLTALLMSGLGLVSAFDITRYDNVSTIFRVLLHS